MPDQDFESTCSSENEVYDDFSFVQKCKALAEWIADIVVDNLDDNKNE